MNMYTKSTKDMKLTNAPTSYNFKTTWTYSASQAAMG